MPSVTRDFNLSGAYAGETVWVRYLDATNALVVGDPVATVEVAGGVYRAVLDRDLFLAGSAFCYLDGDDPATVANRLVMYLLDPAEHFTDGGRLDLILDGIAAIFTGMTSLPNWLRGMFRKDTMDVTANGEINAGGGTFDETTDSIEAIRDTAPLGTAMRGTDGAMLASNYTAPDNAGIGNAAADAATIKGKLPAGGALMHAAGAAVARSPATIAVGDIAENAIDAASIKADAVTKIQSGLATATAVGAIPTTPLLTNDSRISATAPPTKVEMDAAFTAIKGATWSESTDTLEHIRDKEDGVILAATGLDAISDNDPTGEVDTWKFPQYIVWLIRRFFNSSKTATTLSVKGKDGTTVLTTQAITESGNTQTIGKPEAE